MRTIYICAIALMSFSSLSAQTLDYYNLQFPGSGSIDPVGSLTTYAQAYEPGVTPGAGQGTGVLCWIGVHTANTDPSTWPSGAWTAANYFGEVGNNDEFSLDIGNGLAPGTYYYASRFSLSAGPYTYGGTTGSGGNAWDGVTNVSGVLTVNNPQLDYNNLQFPGSGTITSAGSLTVFAQGFEPGVTPGAGQGSGVECWIGVNSSNTDPSTWSSGAWTAATYFGEVGNNDEFSLGIGNGLTPGTYYYASRFRYNGGNYTYGGFNSGTWDGSTNVSGVLTVNCAPPSNDDCAGAIDIMPTLFGYATWDTLSVCGATQSLAGCTGNADDDTWYSWECASANDVILAKDLGASSDLVVEVFSSCGGTNLGCYDNYGSGAIERVWPGSLTVGSTYYFRVFDKAAGGVSSDSLLVMVKTFADGGIRTHFCGTTDYEYNDYFVTDRQDYNMLYPYTTVAVVQYGVRLTDQSTSAEYERVNGGANGMYFNFNQFPGIPLNASFDAHARHSLNVPANGTLNLMWSEYGSGSCTLGLGGATETRIRTQYCSGMVDYSFGDILLAEPVQNATAYRYTFVSGGETLIRTKSSYSIPLSDVPGLSYGNTYVVTVEAQLNGEWSDPGATCSINMETQPPATRVRAQYCPSTVLFPGSNYVLAETVIGADLYQWEFTPSLGGAPFSVMTTGYSLGFGPMMPVEENTTYNVEVRARVNNVWGDYSDLCSITIQPAPMAPAMDGPVFDKSQIVSEGNLGVYPNPSNGTEFLLNMEGLDLVETNVDVQIIDVTGKVIQSDRYPLKGSVKRLKIEMNRPLDAGLYFVKLRTGLSESTARMVVNR